MSTLNLSNASFLSTNSQSNFLGDNLDISRIETISIRGFIDKRTDNDDHVGVREVFSEITSLLANNDDYWTDNLIINGRNYGKGRVTSLSFNSSPGATDNMVTLGQYSATIEIYKQGDLFGLAENEPGILGHHYPTKTALQSARHEYLENFAFNTTWNEDGPNVSVNESVSISYLSGDSSFNPKLAARELANSLLGYSTGHLSTAGSYVSHASLSSAGRGSECATGDYSEEYDDINLKYNFGRRITWYGSGGHGLTTVYGCKYMIKHSRDLNYDENGNVEVTEKGNIFGLADSDGYAASADRSGKAWGANEGIRIELNKSYGRCNGMFNNYTGLANQEAKNVFSLNTNPIERGKTLDSGAGVGSYTVKYTNKQRLSGTAGNNNFINEWRQVATFDADNNVQIIENGTIKEWQHHGSPYSSHKRADFNAGGYGNFYNTLTTSANNRAGEFYDRFVERIGIDGCSNKNNLKLIEENREQFFFGPEFSYTKTYSDDPTILSDADAALIGWKQVKVVKEISVPVAMSKEYLIPRQGINGELVQIMDQMSLGTLTINIQAAQKGPQDWFSLRPTDFGPLTAGYVTLEQALKNLVDYYVLPVAHAFPGLSKTKIREMWISDVNYNFNSEYDCNLVVTINYTVENYL